MTSHISKGQHNIRYPSMMFGLFLDDVHIFLKTKKIFVYNVIEYVDHSNDGV